MLTMPEMELWSFSPLMIFFSWVSFSWKIECISDHSGLLFCSVWLLILIKHQYKCLICFTFSNISSFWCHRVHDILIMYSRNPYITEHQNLHGSFCHWFLLFTLWMILLVCKFRIWLSNVTCKYAKNGSQFTSQFALMQLVKTEMMAKTCRRWEV